MSSNSQQHVISVKSLQPSNRFTNGHLTPLNDYNKSSSNLHNSTSQIFNSNLSLNSININNNIKNSTINSNSSTPNNGNNLAYQRRFNKSVTLGNASNNNFQQQISQLNVTNTSSPTSSINNANLTSTMNSLTINNNIIVNGTSNLFASSSNLSISPLKNNQNVPLFHSKKFADDYRAGSM